MICFRINRELIPSALGWSLTINVCSWVHSGLACGLLVFWLQIIKLRAFVHYSVCSYIDFVLCRCVSFKNKRSRITNECNWNIQHNWMEQNVTRMYSFHSVAYPKLYSENNVIQRLTSLSYFVKCCDQSKYWSSIEQDILWCFSSENYIVCLDTTPMFS